MTKVQFKEAFRRGLGCAYLELQNPNSREKFKDIVLWCCIHNTCYDMQCEGSRGYYLYTAIQLYEEKSFFEDALINNYLRKSQLDTWLFEQYSDFLFHFAKNGSNKAHNALYEKYNTLLLRLSKIRKKGATWPDRDIFEWLCVWLTSLDGFHAYKKIVNDVGKHYLKAKEINTFFLDWFHDNSINKFGEKRVYGYLRKNAPKSNAITAFLKEVESFKTQKPASIASPTLEELIKECHKPSSFRCRGIALHFARNASSEELIELAQVAIKEMNLNAKLNLLWAFRKKQFPLDEKLIFELTESDNESIRNIAFKILQHMSSDKIHDYAINLIKEKKEVANALCLLCHCFKPEDETLLTEGVMSLTVSYDTGIWHGIFMDIEDMLNKNFYRFNPDLLLHIYRSTLCSYCRSNLVETMYKRKILPEQILKECLYDSYDDTRKFATKKLKYTKNQ